MNPFKHFLIITGPLPVLLKEVSYLCSFDKKLFHNPSKHTD
jgi:hypothetical protein